LIDQLVNYSCSETSIVDLTHVITAHTSSKAFEKN